MVSSTLYLAEKMKKSGLTGKIVYTNVFENTNGEIIDLSSVHKGIYLVKILIDKQLVEVQKLELK